MKKSKIYGKWRHYKNISLYLIVVGFIVAGATSIYALRSNNLKMVELRQAVYNADETDGDVETALNNLRQFVYGHMNTALGSSDSTEPPIQLVNQFNKAVEAEQARIEALGGANKVYVEAQNQCEIASIPLMARARCIQDYVSAHAQNAPKLNLPPKEIYTFNFASPTWSPDLAGWSLVIAGLFGALLIFRLLAGIYMNMFIKK